ncbi:MAG: hypothetical protein Q8862_05600 [Bacteroidota bacterium]|nr:hypothetical protein [Bacteroidota bacterium]
MRLREHSYQQKCLIGCRCASTSVDFLINGNTIEKARNTIKDAELLNKFKAVEQMEEVKRLLDAFITKKKIKKCSILALQNCEF